MFKVTKKMFTDELKKYVGKINLTYKEAKNVKEVMERLMEAVIYKGGYDEMATLMATGYVDCPEYSGIYEHQIQLLKKVAAESPEKIPFAWEILVDFMIAQGDDHLSTEVFGQCWKQLAAGVVVLQSAAIKLGELDEYQFSVA